MLKRDEGKSVTSDILLQWNIRLGLYISVTSLVTPFQ